MIEFELNGKTVYGNDGATILEVALENDCYIPHFCYHKKLSVAANCRICIVEMEKARSPVPACATPISQGMKVHTRSKVALDAQHGVMEFLLANHPLDCPVCDQGGECQLQDLAVGYGNSSSRFTETKRVVSEKNLGSLITTHMTRCIHCSRCIRFSDEIAGHQELGMSYRNNHVEVMPFIGSTVKSELSGNMIDICPVGALTSKPFQDSARSWELSRRKTISPHDSFGTNLIAQVDKYQKVVRILPFENELINECWISDRDRFSYEGLYHKDRCLSPMIKDTTWKEVSWDKALARFIDTGKSSVLLASEISTNEELFLLEKLSAILNIPPNTEEKYVKLINVQEMLSSKTIVVIGCMLRNEEPLLNQKIRQAVKKGVNLYTINTVLQENHIPATEILTDPRDFTYILGQILDSALKLKNIRSIIELDVATSKQTDEIATLLDDSYILVGNIAETMDCFNEIAMLIQEISNVTGAKFGILPEKANSIGAKQFNLFNSNNVCDGSNYILFNTELEYDANNSQLALAKLNKAKHVTVFTSYVNDEMMHYADIILPIAPFTETGGSYINLEGIVQQFYPVTKPLGNSKPAWKILQQLCCMFGVETDYSNTHQLHEDIDVIKNIKSRNITIKPFKVKKANTDKLIRISNTGIYATNSAVRRAKSLQETEFANTPLLKISQALATKLNIKENDVINVKQSHSSGKFPVKIADIPETTVFLDKVAETITFAGIYDSIELII